MKTSVKVIIGLAGITSLIIIGFVIQSQKKVVLNEALPTSNKPAQTQSNNQNNKPITSEPITISQGALVPKEHAASGNVLVLETSSEKTLRFENFETINGPDLRVYLATDFIDLGPLKATSGNINYNIPAGTDTSKYKYAMIWCRAFRVLFSYAELQ